MFTLYNAISADGFIAHEDGSEDFIPDEAWAHFLSLCKKYGAIVLSSKAYESLQMYEPGELEKFESLDVRRIVVSANAEFEVKPGYILAHSPEEAREIAPDALVSSGPTLNDYLIDKGMAEKIILLRLPESIGSGIKAFNAGVRDVPVFFEHL